MLPNISRNKANQSIKFGQLVKYYSMRNIFFENHAENEVGELVPYLLFLNKALYKAKASDQHLTFNKYK